MIPLWSVALVAITQLLSGLYLPLSGDLPGAVARSWCAVFGCASATISAPTYVAPAASSLDILSGSGILVPANVSSPASLTGVSAQSAGPTDDGLLPSSSEWPPVKSMDAIMATPTSRVSDVRDVVVGKPQSSGNLLLEAREFGHTISWVISLALFGYCVVHIARYLACIPACLLAIVAAFIIKAFTLSAGAYDRQLALEQSLAVRDSQSSKIEALEKESAADKQTIASMAEEMRKLQDHCDLQEHRQYLEMNRHSKLRQAALWGSISKLPSSIFQNTQPATLPDAVSPEHTVAGTPTVARAPQSAPSSIEPEKNSDLTVVEYPQHAPGQEILPVTPEPSIDDAIETITQENEPTPLSETSTPEYNAAASPIVARETCERSSDLTVVEYPQHVPNPKPALVEYTIAAVAVTAQEAESSLPIVELRKSSDVIIAEHPQQCSNTATMEQQERAQPREMETPGHQEQNQAQDAEVIEQHVVAQVEDMEMLRRQEKTQSQEVDEPGQQTMVQSQQAEILEQQELNESQELASSGQQVTARCQEVEMSDLQEEARIPVMELPKHQQEAQSQEVEMSGQQERAQVADVEMSEQQEQSQPRKVTESGQQQKTEPQDVEMSDEEEKENPQDVEMSDEEEKESPQDVDMSDQGVRSGPTNLRTKHIVLITPVQNHGTSSIVSTQPDNMVLDLKPLSPPRVLEAASHRDEMIVEPTPVPTLHPVAAAGDRAAPDQPSVASPATCTVPNSRKRSADTSVELPTSQAQQSEQTTSEPVDTPAALPRIVSPLSEPAVSSQPTVVEEKGELNEVRGGKKLKVCADESSIRPSTVPTHPKAARNPGLKHVGGNSKQLECVDTVSVFKGTQKAAVDSKMSDPKEEDDDDKKELWKELFGEDGSDDGHDDGGELESQSSTSGTLKPQAQSRGPLDSTPHIQPRSVAVESPATKRKPTLWLPGVATGALWQNEALRGTSRPQQHDTTRSAAATRDSTTPPPPGPSYSETGKATDAQLRRWQRKKEQQDSVSLPPTQCQKPAKSITKMQICSKISAASPSVVSPVAVHVPTETKGDKKRGCDDAGLEANDAAPSSAFPSSAEINTMEDVPDIQRKKWSVPARKAIGEVITPSSIPVVPFAPAERPTKIWHDPVSMPSPGEVAAAIPSEATAYSTLWNKFEYDKVKKVYRKEADFVRFIKTSRIGVITVREVDDNIAGIAMKTKKKFVMPGPGNDTLLYVAPSSAAPISVPSQWPDMPSAEAVRTALRNRPSRTMNWKMLYEMFRDQHNAEGKKLDEGQFFKYIEEERLGKVSMADYGTKAVVTYREG